MTSPESHDEHSTTDIEADDQVLAPATPGAEALGAGVAMLDDDHSPGS